MLAAAADTPAKLLLGYRWRLRFQPLIEGDLLVHDADPTPHVGTPASKIDMRCCAPSERFPVASGMGKKTKKEKLKHRPLPLRLAEYRAQYGMSQAALADKMETSDVTIGRIEGGKQNWNQEFLQEAARLFGVHWLDLLPLPSQNTVLDVWAQIPAHERDRALAALKIFSKKTAA